MDGQHWEHGLTPRQLQVLRLVAEGHSGKQIARELGIQQRTVRGHMTAIFERFHVQNRTGAVVAAWRRGWVT